MWSQLICRSRSAYRLMRFHLLDNTRGEPNFWQRDEVEEHKLKVRTPEGKPLRRIIEGQVLARAWRGARLRCEGSGIHRSGRRARFPSRRQDRRARGPLGGVATYTPGARPGRTPLGVAFSLADMENDPAAKVPPQGSHWLDGYFDADRR